MTDSRLRVALLYPELLGTYGDRGNAVVLRKRLEWRGLSCELVTIGLSQAVPTGCDLYLLGGGEDDAQSAALSALRRTPGLAAAVTAGAHVFAVCAGLQILGVEIHGPGRMTTPGLGLLDVTTKRRQRRAVGEVVTLPMAQLGLPALTGFENHGGGTRLGAQATPLATVISGVGNGSDDPSQSSFEGAIQGNVVATYLHGPVLARNPELADFVLSRALGHPLAPLGPQAEIDRLRTERLSTPGRTRKFHLR